MWEPRGGNNHMVGTVPTKARKVKFQVTFRVLAGTGPNIVHLGTETRNGYKFK